LDYFGDYIETAAWVDQNIKPEEKILIYLRNANILHVLTSGNRSFDAINDCVGDDSFVPAIPCTPPYITFWIYNGETNPDGPRVKIFGISEPSLISTIQKKEIKYIIVTPKIYYLYFYLKIHPSFQEVTRTDNNVIFRVIAPVQPISGFLNAKWETCVGDGTSKYLKNLHRVYPERFETRLSEQFIPWMGLSRQDVTSFENWQGCVYDSIFPGKYLLP
jgi:hypothetical protein